MLSIQNRLLRLTLSPDQATWNISHLIHPEFAFTQATSRLLIKQSGKNEMFLDTWKNFAVYGPENNPTPLGASQTIRLESAPTSKLPGLRTELIFALPDSPACLLWKIKLHNQLAQAVTLERIDLIASHPATTIQFGNPEQDTLDKLVFFSNGWQSWSYTGAYAPQDRYRQTRLGLLHRPMTLNQATPTPRQPGHFASDMFGVIGSRTNRRAWLVGFLSQQQHFGSLAVRLDRHPPALQLWANGDHVRLDPGQSLETDWACIFPMLLDQPDPLGAYTQAVARAHGCSTPQRAPVNGWCSWYHYYQKVQESDVQENVQSALELRKQLPLDLIQLDDGFQHAVGDWLNFSPNFPQGVAPLASHIDSHGFTPGLWLAPFIVDPRSDLAHRHPEWLLRGRFNRPVNAGYTFWGAFATALDLTHPEALDYATRIVRTAAQEWGYPFLKLDFLYAAALPGKYRDPTRTRAQVMRLGLEALRQAAGEECFLLGCGCPLGSAIGLVDGMRVSSDVSEEWEPSFSGIHTFFRHEPDFPSIRNATHNSLTRSFMHRRWWLNDPDVLLPGPDLPFSEAEFETLATVTALTGGVLLVSGQLSQIPAHRLRQWASLLPLIDQRPSLPDWIESPTPRRLRFDLENTLGSWHVLAYFNWADEPEKINFAPEDFNLPENAMTIMREFWTGQVYPMSLDIVTEILLPAHGVRLFALRDLTPGIPAYLGSDLHISQGLEVSDWKVAQLGEEYILEIYLERPGHAQGSLDLYLPNPPKQVLLNDLPISFIELMPGYYRFNLAFNRTAAILIQVPSTG